MNITREDLAISHLFPQQCIIASFTVHIGVLYVSDLYPGYYDSITYYN